MTLDERMELADQLSVVVAKALAPHLLTGTGKECRERKQELTRLVARVSAVVMYDGLPTSEQVFRVRRLENEMQKFADSLNQHVWLKQ